MTPMPIIPLAEPLPLPAPVWLMWSLLMLTFVLHLIAMNLLLGGSIIAAYARLRRSANIHARELIRSFTRIAPVLVAATVTLGVAPLLFLQVLYGRVFFTSSILMAWLWLAVVPAIIVIYYGAYVLSMRHRGDTPLWLHALTVCGLAGVAFLYSTNMTMMLRADQFGPMYAASGRGLHLNLSDPTFWPRWLHMMLGAVGVAGVATAIFGATRRSTQPEFARWTVRYGAAFGAVATGLNAVVGVWWAFALPSSILSRLTSGTLNTALLTIGMVTGAMVVVMLAAQMRRTSLPLAMGSLAAMLVTLIAMAFTRDGLRTVSLEAVGFMPASWIEPQWLPIALFAALLVIAIGTVGWMAFTLRTAFQQAPTVGRHAA